MMDYIMHQRSWGTVLQLLTTVCYLAQAVPNLMSKPRHAKLPKLDVRKSRPQKLSRSVMTRYKTLLRDEPTV